MAENKAQETQRVSQVPMSSEELKAFFREERLGEKIAEREERYGLSWAGKSLAKKAVGWPTTNTFRLKQEESKDAETTGNLFLEGDNLETLKLLNKRYFERVKMIYIDPPYNTGKDFIYKDNFTEGINDYLEKTGQTDEDGVKLTTNAETNGRYHSDWLTMMASRLTLARKLLREDGVIFVSIDDNEAANLRLLMDEIFGEENFVAQIVWEKKYSPQNDATYFSDMHDFVLCYAKRKITNINKNGWVRNLLLRTDEQDSRYNNPDNDPRGLWKSSDMSVKTYSAKYDYEIVTPSKRVTSPPKGRCWRFGKEKYEEMLRDNRIWFGNDGTASPSIKRFLSEVKQGIVPSTLWFRKDVGDNQEAAKEIRALFKEYPPFDTPKPTKLIRRMLQLSTSKSGMDLVLDFFAGSGTTAHAVMAQNAEDSGNRKFILVQIPEATDEKSEAYKAGYKTIADIAKERIRRAGKKVREEFAEKLKDRKEPLDTGFRVFSLGASNYRQWEAGDFDEDEEKFLETQELFVQKPLVDGYREEDVVYETMLKEGFSLTSRVSQETNGNLALWRAADFGDGEKASEDAKEGTEESPRVLLLTFAPKVTFDDVLALKLAPTDTFVCFDAALTDSEKVNIVREINLKVI